MRHSPARSTAQHGRARKGALVWGRVPRSRLPPQRRGSTQTQRRAPPQLTRAPALLPPPPSLQTSAADVKLCLHHNVFHPALWSSNSLGWKGPPQAPLAEPQRWLERQSCRGCRTHRGERRTDRSPTPQPGSPRTAPGGQLSRAGAHPSASCLSPRYIFSH